MKIKPGKYYRRGNGDVVGPIRMMDPRHINEGSGFKYVFEYMTYKEDGKFSMNEEEHPWDLVNEVEIRDLD